MESAKPGRQRTYNAKPRDARTKRLMALAELPESHLTAKELAELDAYVSACTAEIRANWTADEESARRGVDQRKTAKVFVHDDRQFNNSTSGLMPTGTVSKLA